MLENDWLEISSHGSREVFQQYQLGTALKNLLPERELRTLSGNIQPFN